MKFITSPAFLCLVLFATGYSQSLPERRELKEITVSGAGYERGLQHGRALRHEIAEVVERWKANARRVTKQDPDEVLDKFLKYARFTQAILTWTPDLYDEVRGIADGSGQPFEQVFVLNLLDEFWVFVDIPESHHCSSIGVPASGNRPAYVAQNMDLEPYSDGFQVLMRIRRDGDEPEQLVLTQAGVIGLNGMNEAGVGVCVNTLMQLKASPAGLPVAFVVRSLLTKTDMREILRFIDEVKHASGQNYIIGVGSEVFDFEVSANKVSRFWPIDTGGTVFHTNHALVNDDFKPWYQNQDVYSENSSARLAAVRKRATKGLLQELGAIRETLRSKDDPLHPVCRANRGGESSFTFASTIMTLGDKPFLQLTVGPPDESDYRVFHFLESKR